MTPPKPRMQSQTERDLAGLQARKERDAAPLVEVSGEITGKYDGDELVQMRGKRATEERIERLEAKHDTVDSKVDEIGQRVARMEGKLDTALSVIVPAHRESHATERARIDGRTKVIIAIVGGIGTLVGIVVSALSGCA